MESVCLRAPVWHAVLAVKDCASRARQPGCVPDGLRCGVRLRARRQTAYARGDGEPVMKIINEVIHGDCIEVLREVPSESVGLVVTDPRTG
jgi:hypothetical protein